MSTLDNNSINFAFWWSSINVKPKISQVGDWEQPPLFKPHPYVPEINHQLKPSFVYCCSNLHYVLFNPVWNGADINIIN